MFSHFSFPLLVFHSEHFVVLKTKQALLALPGRSVSCGFLCSIKVGLSEKRPPHPSLLRVRKFHKYTSSALPSFSIPFLSEFPIHITSALVHLFFQLLSPFSPVSPGKSSKPYARIKCTATYFNNSMEALFRMPKQTFQATPNQSARINVFSECLVVPSLQAGPPPIAAPTACSPESLTQWSPSPDCNSRSF
jgi:hypothetical protein